MGNCLPVRDFLKTRAQKSYQTKDFPFSEYHLLSILTTFPSSTGDKIWFLALFFKRDTEEDLLYTSLQKALNN